VAIIYGTARQIASWPACLTWHPIRGTILVERIRISSLNLNIQFYHVYHQNNTEAVVMVNVAIGLAPSILGVDGVERLLPPRNCYGLATG
jgi:hypothetical protein